MIKPPFRPRKSGPVDRLANAEKAAAGMWPYCMGRGVTTKPVRVSLDGKQIAAFRPGIFVVVGEVDDFAPSSED